MERRFDYHALSVPIAQTVLTAAFPGRRLAGIELLTEGYINTNYMLHVDGLDAPLVLRIYARDPSACRKEVAIAQLVQGRVPVPAVLFADPEGEHLGTPCIITSWIEGVKARTVIEQGTPDDAAAVGRAIGTVLGAISGFTFDRPGFFGPGLEIAQPLPGAGLGFVRQCLGHPLAAERLGQPLLTQLLAFVLAHEPLLDVLADDRSLVHADFSLDNLFVHRVVGKWSVAAVLDWEFAFAGSSLFDIGILLRHDPFLNSPFANAVVSGFRQHRTLPPNWRQLVRLLDLNNLCDFLVGKEAGVHRTDVVQRLLTETMTNWDALL